MPLQRIWPEGVYVRSLPELGSAPPYAQVVVATGTQKSIHVAGTLSFDENQELVGEGDMQLQVRTVLDHIRRSLAAAGATPADVVRIKAYFTDIEAFRGAVDQYFTFFEGDERPASTSVQVAALADPRCLVEMEVEAKVGEITMSTGEDEMSLERLWPEGIYKRTLPDYGYGETTMYSQVVVATGVRKTVHVAGTLSFDENQELVGEGDMQLQVRTVLDHIRRSLAAAGATPADVVRIKVYTTDVQACMQEGGGEILEFFGRNERPCSTGVQVVALADPRCMVEIEVDAELA